MSNETSPEAALDAARSARRAALGSAEIPRWFPAVAGLSCALGFGIFGLAALGHDGLRVALSLAGGALWAVNVLALGLLAWRWQRGGVMPRTAGTEPSVPRRWVWVSTGGLIPVPVIAGGLAWWATGQIGWGCLVSGVLLGAATWWRLRVFRDRVAG